MAAVILGACRTPIGSLAERSRDVGVADLGAIAVRRPGIARAARCLTGDVVLGCVLQGGQGMNVARQAAIKAGVPSRAGDDDQPRLRVGARAVVTASQAIARSDYAVAIAGGMESMSNAAHVLRGARWGYRMGHAEVTDAMIHDGLTDAMHSCHGRDRREIASRYAISRADQDAFAAESQRRAVSAIASGAFAEEIVPVVLPQKKDDRSCSPSIARRHDGREAGRAAGGVQEGRQRDRRQRVGHQRRRCGAGRGV
jgi:acetyl-CoA C-acetyltransferase